MTGKESRRVPQESTERSPFIRHSRQGSRTINVLQSCTECRRDTAGTAEEALNKIEESRPDLIISDIRLPGMDGIDLCRIVRQKKIRCRIIFISGYFNREYVKVALELEAEDYIEKPIRLSEMEKAIGKAADRLQP